jgi:hypothetical protein
MERLLNRKSGDAVMSYSITQVLYDWMHEKRIVALVAREMGMIDSTLSAKLRPSNPQAKLSADELVPLFDAIRREGYEKELEGVLHEFIQALRDPGSLLESDEPMVPLVLSLARGLGALSECAGRIASTTDEGELVKMCTMLRTEVLPVVLRMEALVDSRLKKVRKGQLAQSPQLDPALVPQH